jgi:hypothetical protein
MINISIEHQPAAYATAQGHIKHRIEIRACSVARFAQCADIRIIIHSYWRASKRVQPSC